jgi:predicted RNase H-like HicB family nuclease
MIDKEIAYKALKPFIKECTDVMAKILLKKPEHFARVSSVMKKQHNKTFTAVVEKDHETGLFVGYIPGFPGAHSQATSLDELQANLVEVVSMLLEDSEPVLESAFVGTQSITVA